MKIKSTDRSYGAGGQDWRSEPFGSLILEAGLQEMGHADCVYT